jgi:hypothetical protein
LQKIGLAWAGRAGARSAIFGTDLGSFFEIRTWLLAIVGSLILLGIYRLVTGRRTHA